METATPAPGFVPAPAVVDVLAQQEATPAPKVPNLNPLCDFCVETPAFLTFADKNIPMSVHLCIKCFKKAVSNLLK